MSTKCIECGHKFSLREALCEDWRDPEKSFGCPNCKTFFKKELRPQYRYSIIVGLMSGGVATPAAMLLGDSLNNDNTKGLVLSGCILLSCLIVLSVSSWGKVKSKHTLEKVDS